MKKMIIVISIILCLVIGIAVFATTTNIIEATLVDYRIWFSGRRVNESLQNPLIMYNNRIYMSVRDVGVMISRDVQWNENYRDVSFNRLEIEQSLIQSEETALAIAKAIVSERYSNQINENTRYFTFFMQASPSRIDFYLVAVMFNTSTDQELDMENDNDILEILHNADVQIEIGTATGSTTLRERIDGSLEWVVGRTGILEID